MKLKESVLFVGECFGDFKLLPHIVIRNFGITFNANRFFQHKIDSVRREKQNYLVVPISNYQN